MSKPDGSPKGRSGRVDKNGNYDLKVGFREPRSQQTTAKGKRSYSQITNAQAIWPHRS